MSRKQNDNPRKKHLVDIAESTINALERGSYLVEDIGEIHLTEPITRCIENTRLYEPDSILAAWASRPSSKSLVSSDWKEAERSVSKKDSRISSARTTMRKLGEGQHAKKKRGLNERCEIEIWLVG